MTDSSAHPTRMPLFLTGWRYITTAEAANELPLGTVAIVDDAFLWDATVTDDGWVPTLTPAAWDGVVEVQQRDFVHGCHHGCDGGPECRYVWNETGDTKDHLLPELPFFAWHPTFCSGDA